MTAIVSERTACCNIYYLEWRGSESRSGCE